MDRMESLSSSSMCQLQLSVYIADSIDAGNAVLKMFISQDPSSFHGRSKAISKQTGCIRFSTGSDQNSLSCAGADRIFFLVGA